MLKGRRTMEDFFVRRLSEKSEKGHGIEIRMKLKERVL